MPFNPFPAIRAAWAFLTSPLALKLLAGLLLAALWWRGSHYRDDRDRWREAFSAQKQATIATAAAARAKAVAARISTENTYAELARRADNADAEIDDLRTRARRYADARRLRPESAGNARGGPAAAGEAGVAESGDGPGGDAGLLVVTRADFDILVENTARLKRVNTWGRDMIDAGLAIPEVEFGKPREEMVED